VPELPLFPVTVVGSLPRFAEAQSAPDEAVRKAVALQEAAGVDVITDGEQRRDNFYSFIAERVDGVRLMTLSELLDYVEDKAAFERLLEALDVPAFAIKNPVVVGPIAAREPLALEDFRFVRSLSSRRVKVCLPGPYLLARSMWVKRLSAEFYPTKEAMGDAVVALLQREVRALRDAGCDFVQFDEPVLSEVAFTGPHATHTFMCAALSEKSSPEEELRFAVSLINRVVAEAGDMRTGVHICRGNWSRDESVLLSGAYDPLVPHLARMHVTQVVLECATERAGALDSLANLPAAMELGFGCCDPRTDEIESVSSIVDRVEQIVRLRGAQGIFLNPDCGFGTFADRPVSSLETAQAKLAQLHEAAAVLRERHAAIRA
jgi:5-methyltetrahydropteroyltriglutamate--homocysteine methyltransferase